MGKDIYISSTYQDLYEFRKGVFECILGFKGKYEPNGMELYYAEDIDAVERCILDVKACDLYLLILGSRYGTIFNKYDRSVTEIEYDTAVAAGKEILVFEVGNMAEDYQYQERDQDLKRRQKDFKKKIARLRGKPFNSIAELQFQVSMSLSRRLFKDLKEDTDITIPDTDSLCYCDRQSQVQGLKIGVATKKKVFFIPGNRDKDIPPYLAKRFAKYSLGSVNKIEPLINISKMFSSINEESQAEACFEILEYLDEEPSEEAFVVDGLLELLDESDQNKTILPFYYDADFKDEEKFIRFLKFLDDVYFEYATMERSFELYVLIFIYSTETAAEEVESAMKHIESEENGIRKELKNYVKYLEPMGPIDNNDIKDWLEDYWTSAECSNRLFETYFNANQAERSMQITSEKVKQMIEDITLGKEEIIKLLKTEN